MCVLCLSPPPSCLQEGGGWCLWGDKTEGLHIMGNWVLSGKHCEVLAEGPAMDPSAFSLCQGLPWYWRWGLLELANTAWIQWCRWSTQCPSYWWRTQETPAICSDTCRGSGWARYLNLNKWWTKWWISSCNSLGTILVLIELETEEANILQVTRQQCGQTSSQNLCLWKPMPYSTIRT